MPTSEKALDVRVAIEGSEPEIWRSLRLPLNAPLNTLHEAIQRAFGWENRHLHLFHPEGVFGEARPIAGNEESAREMDMDSAEGMTVAQLLSGEGSTLVYEYDLGDTWLHAITVTGHAIVPAGQISCLGGENRGPLEDAGGIWGYQEKLRILADPSDPEHEEIADWVQYVSGVLHPSMFDPTEFDLDAVNKSLDRMRIVLADEPPTPEERAAVLRPVRWLLDRAREDGLELTKDGYVKPAVVREAVLALELGYPWDTYASPREVNVPPIALLREHIQYWKLLRKYKGRLQPSPAARRTYDDDAALWDCLADRMADQENLALRVGLEVLVRWLLGDQHIPRSQHGHAMMSELFHAGLRPSRGGMLTEEDGEDIYNELRRQLNSLGLFEGDLLLGGRELTPAGLKFLLALRRRFEAAR
ncbi:plasmid pRiA4b ORF-3 family protein [Arthrobacter sp. CAU 1506]|uniref:plasmid pRiA4b ORF-3 family protein n=1 Tax=Arthrobacter sp. CAU 1506 TaxID=2560052 RepID=UPI0010ACA7AC|nr:plasmid pRiA4b ORF-3 family protein [Arthrobacter sp. CAU 1506]TJY72577.1 plasmid pRiA4b ORF-3 family protein [Arthrobacter sp. CAU 1506]